MDEPNAPQLYTVSEVLCAMLVLINDVAMTSDEALDYLMESHSIVTKTREQARAAYFAMSKRMRPTTDHLRVHGWVS